MARIFHSAGIVAASTIASRVMGLVRDMLVAALFGATMGTDAFYAAFRIPNLVRRFTAEGVLTISFIPVYVEYLRKKDTAAAMELAQKTMTVLLILMMLMVVSGMIFSREIVQIIAMGFDDKQQIWNAVVMARIMFPYLFMAAILAFCMGLLNSHNYFFAPSFSPFLFNIGIITGAVLFSRFFEEPLHGICAGVLFGGLLQILLQLPYMVRTGYKMKLSLDLKHPGVKRIFKLAVPGAFSMGIQQINILTGTVLGSFLPQGSISYIYFSDRLHELVLGIFAVSIGNAVFPELSALSADGKYSKLAYLYGRSTQSVLFVAIPATFALMIIGFPVISVLLMHNKFSAYEAEMTYRALFYASMGITGIAVSRISVSALYSLHDGRTPFFAACASFTVNAVCGFFLMRTGLMHAGLTLSASIAATIQMLVLVVALRKRTGDIGLDGIAVSAAKNMVAAALMGLVIWYIAGTIDWKTEAFIKRLLCLSAAVLSGGAVYLIFCRALGVPEVTYIMNRIIRRR